MVVFERIESPLALIDVSYVDEASASLLLVLCIYYNNG